MTVDAAPLRGRTALVTGAASGIGRAVAELLGQRGARVAALDRNSSGLDGVGDLAVVADLSDLAAVPDAIAGVRNELGPIGIVANVAGMASLAPFGTDDYDAAYEATMTVNLAAAVAVSRACLPDLIADGAGRIVNVASTEGLSPQRWMSPYAISKHGVIGLTRALAVELGAQGVTANCVCPGPILTGMTEGIPADARERFAHRHVPAGRYGRPVEVAYVIAALVDPAASYINGAVIPVDGGMTAGTL